MHIRVGGIDMGKVVKKVTDVFSKTIVGGLLGGDEPKAPTLDQPEAAPIADEDALAKARRRTAATRSSGRASTVLTSSGGSGNKLGG
jgi:hypothetical protein